MRIFIITPTNADDAMPYGMADVHQAAVMHNRRERAKREWHVNQQRDPITANMLVVAFTIVAAIAVAARQFATLVLRMPN